MTDSSVGVFMRASPQIWEESVVLPSWGGYCVIRRWEIFSFALILWDPPPIVHAAHHWLKHRNTIMWHMTVVTSKARVQSVSGCWIPMEGGLGAGEDADLEGISLPHPPSFLLVPPLSLMSVFCFLTLPVLLTPKPEDKGMSHHYSFTFESMLTSYYMLNFGLKIQR